MKIHSVFLLLILFSCSLKKEKGYEESPCFTRIEVEKRAVFTLKGKMYKDFDIFNGKGVEEIEISLINQFPVVLVSEKDDSLKIEFFLDNKSKGYGLLGFKKGENCFYQIDTIKHYDSIKSIVYKYYTKEHIAVFEKWIENERTFKLSSYILTLEKQRVYNLEPSDSSNIGPDLNFLSNYRPHKEIELKNLYWDSERIKKETFFWKIYLCHPIFQPESYKCEN